MRRPASIALCVLALWGVSCSGQGEPGGDSANAPIVARASIVLEPPTAGIGKVVTAEMVVSTPPDYRVHPIATTEIAGVWMLETIAHPVEKSARRWLHRTSIRMRPRETGRYIFPGTSVVIETAQGEQQTLQVQTRVFEVLSVLPQFPDRTAPFGLQEAQRLPPAVGVLWPALIGALLALAGVALFAAIRRGRQPDESLPGSAPEPAETQSLWDWAHSELSAALESVDQEPRQAANRGAHFLRHYVESRFRTRTAASSTEELSEQKPPLAAHSHWPDFVRVLQRIDDLRFRSANRSGPEAGLEAQQVRSALEELRVFFEQCSPPDRRS